jgi:hypothetical protein
MKTTLFLKQTLMLGALLLLSSGAAQAANYRVNINTAPLVGSANGPFSLDFQFFDGGVLGNNTVKIGNFSFVGGNAVGSATTFDGATGSIGSTVIFNNSGTFQELYQEFSGGTTSIGFDVSMTQNVDGLTPDGFTIAILDGNTFNITTNGLGDSLLHADLNTNGALTIAQLNPASGTGEYTGVTLTAAIPEPDTYAMLLAGLGLLGLAARRKQPRV